MFRYVKYEDTIRRICGENWREAGADERDGGFGVACVLAYLDGCRPSLEDLARYLSQKRPTGEYDTGVLDIEIGFRRLQASGVFAKEFNARRDKGLNAWGPSHEGRTAWCQIAGIASGYVGQGYYITRNVPQPATES